MTNLSKKQVKVLKQYQGLILMAANFPEDDTDNLFEAMKIHSQDPEMMDSITKEFGFPAQDILDYAFQEKFLDKPGKLDHVKFLQYVSIID